MAKALTVISALVLVAFAGVVTGCGEKASGVDDSSSTEPGGGNSDGGGDGSTPTVPTVTDDNPIALKVYTMYDGIDFAYNFDFTSPDSLNSGKDTCTVSSSTYDTNCTVSIPEGRLYYSQLYFSISHLSSTCYYGIFSPYFYQASTSNFYVPPGQLPTAGVDCSSTYSLPATCFGGAAPWIVSNFTYYHASQTGTIGNIYRPNETDLTVAQSYTEKVPSAYSATYLTNRMTVNDLTNSTMKATGLGAMAFSAYLTNTAVPGPGDGLIANSYHDYTIECRDKWYDPQPFNTQYKIHLYIKDVDSDTGNGPENDYDTWNHYN